ncbi:hypothetical protein GCM10025874_25430 [Arenivirga flava]|uniref:Uncharacterized protein n=1 Tax=Arenivirga flava TaxID=1930060 RepID=A0AA37UGY5_9MICO|nr:hypothetical protein GCM10025874_25430 [Arenivirga flava]
MLSRTSRAGRSSAIGVIVRSVEVEARAVTGSLDDPGRGCGHRNDQACARARETARGRARETARGCDQESAQARARVCEPARGCDHESDQARTREHPRSAAGPPASRLSG